MLYRHIEAYSYSVQQTLKCWALLNVVMVYRILITFLIYSCVLSFPLPATLFDLYSTLQIYDPLFKLYQLLSALYVLCCTIYLPSKLYSYQLLSALYILCCTIYLPSKLYSYQLLSALYALESTLYAPLFKLYQLLSVLYVLRSAL